MKAIVTVVFVILAIIIAMKLLSLALKLVGLLIVIALGVGVYMAAQRYLKGPGNA